MDTDDSDPEPWRPLRMTPARAAMLANVKPPMPRTPRRLTRRNKKLAWVDAQVESIRRLERRR